MPDRWKVRGEAARIPIRSTHVLAILAAAVIVTSAVARSSPLWAPNGIPIAATTAMESNPNIVPDGLGGALIAWRTPTGNRILGVDADGNVRSQWPAGGLVVIGGADPFMVADGAGGVFFTAREPSVISFDHVLPPNPAADGMRQSNDTGAVEWAARGAITSQSLLHSGYVLPWAVPDETGGAFVSYEYDGRFSDAGYVRHYSSASSFIEAAIDDITGFPHELYWVQTPTMCSDAVGGVFVTWGQICSPRVLRLTAQLTVAPDWPSAGIALGPCQYNTVFVGICPDGAGGAYVAWQGYPTGIADLRLQHLTAGGQIAAGWPPDGLVLSPHPTLPGYIRSPYGSFCSIVPDGAGGALVGWTDQRADAGDVYVQRIQSDGTFAPGWTADGVVVGAASGSQQAPVITSDGSGGVFVVWEDLRIPGAGAIYANHVSGSGVIMGTEGPSGVPVSVGANYRYTVRIATDGAGGAFVAWIDNGDGDPDIYATRLGSDFGRAASTLSLDRIAPNPSRVAPAVSFTLSDARPARLELIDVAGRVIERHDIGSLGEGRHVLPLRLQHGGAPGLYFVRLSRAGESRVARLCLIP